MREISYPKRTTLCVGASIILLRNIIVEWKITAGFIGVVRKILYHHPDGPTHNPSYLPAYVIVEFPQSTIPVDKKYFTDRPSTWVNTPAVIESYERKCCNISTIVLRVFISINIHKYQGMIIGPNKIFEYVVIHLLSDTMKKTPELDPVTL